MATSKKSRPAAASGAQTTPPAVPAPARRKSPGKPTASAAVKRRLWLSYPPRLITRPMVWELSQRYPVIFNIRQASVSDEIGILCLELEGPAAAIEKSIQWLEKIGVRVEPVEIGVIEA